MQIDGVHSAVLVALAYCDQFRYALTAQEVWQRLPQKIATDSQLWHGEISQRDVETILGELLDIGLVFASQSEGKNYYFLSHRSHPNHRMKLAQAADDAMEGVAELASFLHKIPWIQAVALTGSLAMHQYKAHDDLDVCIVTKPGTLWLTRLVVGVVSAVTGHRRGWDGEWQPSPSSHQSRWRWCTNLWLEQDNHYAGWAPSLYTAYELLQMKWLWDRGAVKPWLEAKHQWWRAWLPNQVAPQTVPHTVSQTASLRVSSLVAGLNRLAYFIQRWYMAAHITNEKVSLHHAFFHPRATGQLVRQGWLNRLRLAIALFHRHQRWAGWQFSPEVVTAINQARLQGQFVTLVTGVFDGWHSEHQRFMEKARALGGVLIVGVESDVRVRQMKGPSRPIFSQIERSAKIAQSGVADGVFILPELFTVTADYRSLLHLIQPRYLAVSAHSAHQDIKQNLMREVGGEVVIVHEHNPAVSTTQLLEKVRQ